MQVNNTMKFQFRGVAQMHIRSDYLANVEFHRIKFAKSFHLAQ